MLSELSLQAFEQVDTCRHSGCGVIPLLHSHARNLIIIIIIIIIIYKFTIAPFNL